MRRVCILSALLFSVIYADTRLETSVISTTGFEETIGQEVGNVNVITKEDIKKRSENNLEQVLQRAPSITLVPTAFGSSIDMRGQGSRATSNVQVMVNGVSTNLNDSSHTAIPINSFSIDDIEKIEIIPGGGAVLYGNGTQGGVINIITKAGAKKFYAHATARYGSFGQINGWFGVGGPIIKDKLSYKLSFNAYNNQGYRYGDKETGLYGSAELNYAINENHSINAIFSSFGGTSFIAGNATSKQLRKDRRSDNGRVDKTLVKNTNLNVSYTGKFGSHIEVNIMPFFQDSSYNFANDPNAFVDRKIGSRNKLKYDYKIGNLIGGYDLIYNDGGSATGDPVLKLSNSVFLLNKVNLYVDWLSLTTGFRYENAYYDSRRSAKPQSSFPGGSNGSTTIPATSAFRDKRALNNYAWEFTPSIQYRDTGNVYFKYERGFTSPPVNKMLNRSKTTGYSPSNIKPETYDTFELGLKDLIFGQFFSISTFYTDSRNEIFTPFTPECSPPSCFTHYNIGKTLRTGVELYSEQSLLADTLRLSESISYIYTEIKQTVVSSIGNMNIGGVKKGARVPNVPDYKIVLGADYNLRKDLIAFVDSIFYGKQIFSSGDKIAPYNVTNVGVRYKIKSFSITGGINNLFDTEYFIAADFARDAFRVADGRSYYIEARYDF
ncbi:hypothetical protein BKH43_04545 [Helicobacter sp. 13S00401-1]|uniref:TonB-dependent receptor n=1 Tax=Helicobacter sp. 13S00401-1 TaxID=1905758 RepID=UPI000BA52CA3|nr:TonB-dependent receptor [Helicobacter sp. 13S00401-1]PAF50366.1 hypothetical protein BKH43_04545 [Helicobacter sp. 13S00401-1]